MEVGPLLIVIGVFGLAGVVKGVTGMGLPTVAMSLLGLWMAPVQAAALLVAPSLATNLAQCRGPQLRALAARLWPGWVAIVVATIVAPGIGDAGAGGLARGGLGAVLVAYGVWGLARPGLPDWSARGRWLAALAGALTGLVTAVTAVFVLPWVPYLQALRLDKAGMVQALGLSFTVATLALALRVQAVAPGWWASGVDALAVGSALAGAFGGLKLGELLRGRLDDAAFRRALFLAFVALGSANLVRAG